MTGKRLVALTLGLALMLAVRSSAQMVPAPPALNLGTSGGTASCSGDINSGCSQVTSTHLSAALPTAQGGTGTASTLSGIVRGGNPLTASELSGDCTTSGSNAISCTKTAGTSFGPFATQAAPCTVAQGCTGATAISGWPFAIDHASTISGATTETLQNAWVTFETFTFSATATVTIPQGNWNQWIIGIVCQNGTGGFTPSFQPAAGLTITGNGNTCSGSGTTCFPAFTTTASKCGDFSLHYTTTTTAVLTGWAVGPL